MVGGQVWNRTMDVAVFILAVLVFVAVSGALVRLVRVPLPVLQIAIGAALAWPVREINDHAARALFTEITHAEALLKGRQA
jgi:CPA1 family monovalent cation:H+ antiporter